MTILLERYTIPERGVFEIDLKQSIEIRVTAEEARRKVNRWLLDYVSYMMYADPPTLVIDAQVVWRVPAVFTASQVGRAGVVGYVDVDVFTSEANNTQERGEQFMQCAERLAAKLPPYQPGRMKAPDAFIPKHIPRAEILQLART